MTLQESKKIGGLAAIKSAFIPFLLIELFYLYIETRGDFANGILFFLDRQMNLFILLLLLAYFITNYFLGIYAGYNILIKSRNRYLIALYSALIITLLVISFPIIGGLMHSESFTKEKIIETSKISLILFILFALTWLWTIRVINKSKS